MIRFLLVLGGAAIVTAGTQVAAPALAPSVGALSLVILLLGSFALMLPIARAEARRNLPSGPVEAGESIRVETVITFPFALPAVVEVDDGIEGRPPRRLRAVCLGRHVRSAYTLTLSRGLYGFASVVVGAQDPFGLCAHSVRRDIGGAITVWPRGSASEGRRLHDSFLPRRTGRSEEMVLRSVRPATPEDPIRTIHWLQSAKRGSLHVRELEAPRPIVIAVAVRANGPAFERALSQASSLIRYAYAVGRPIALDLGETQIEPGIGRTHFERAMRALSAADPVRCDPSARVAPGYIAVDGEGPSATRIAT